MSVLTFEQLVTENGDRTENSTQIYIFSIKLLISGANFLFRMQNLISLSKSHIMLCTQLGLFKAYILIHILSSLLYQYCYLIFHSLALVNVPTTFPSHTAENPYKFILSYRGRSQTRAFPDDAMKNQDYNEEI